MANTRIIGVKNVLFNILVIDDLTELCELRNLLIDTLNDVDFRISGKKTVVDNLKPDEEAAPITLRCERVDGID